MRVLLFVLAASLAASAIAQQVPADSVQTGRIMGLVTDAATGDPLIGVNVHLVGTQIGAATDIDGRFTIEAAPGTHAVRVAYIGYVQTEAEVAVAGGRATAFSPALEISDFAISCYVVCYQEPVIPRGAFSARVISPMAEQGWCSTVVPGMVYQRNARL